MPTLTTHRGHTASAIAATEDDVRTGVTSAEDLLDLFKSVSLALGEIEGQDETILTVLRAIATKTGWPVGHVYFVDENDDVLVPSNLWHLSNPR